MKNFYRIFFVIILLFFSSWCFAITEQEKMIAKEEAELNNEIIRPIAERFDEKSSFTGLISEEMIRMQENGLVFDSTNKEIRAMEVIQAKEIAKRTIYKEIGEKRYKEMSITMPEICEKFSNRSVSDPPFYGSHEKFHKDIVAKYLDAALRYNSANCAIQMRMAVVILEFNRINKIRLNQPLLFDQVVVVRATPKYGDHWFVLVQGKSGTVFAVDPWFRKVIKLKGAPKLSEITTDLYPNHKLLTSLFAVRYNGKEYYDEAYVREDTQWSLRRDIATAYNDFVDTDDPAPESPHKVSDLNYIAHMEDIYNMLIKNMKFANWPAKYNELPLIRKAKGYEDDGRDL